MIYLERFKILNQLKEDHVLLNYPYQLEMQCYNHFNVYPFKLFPQKQLTELTFEPITIFYGGNGSGKSTLLNVISQKLDFERTAPFNNTPFFDEYVKYCDYELSLCDEPREMKHVASDDVFNYLLDIRSINENVDRKRQQLFRQYDAEHDTPTEPLKSLDEYDAFKRRFEAKKSTKSQFVTKRLKVSEIDGKSNGESAFAYFTHHIKDDSLYLLDEPENSLSPALQMELAQFLSDSARFYGCQFVISTHSPFLLSVQGAKIYDLDDAPVRVKKWTELENVRAYYDFFTEHSDEFQ